MGGKAWFDALHPDDRDYCLDVFKDAFKTHKAFTMEYRLQRRDGEYRHFFDQGEPYINNEGRFAGFVGSSTDVTEQKTYEEELKKSHNELTQYNQEMSLINELNSYLQVCRDITETYSIISYYAEQLFPHCSGALYLFNEGKTFTETVTTWGNAKDFTDIIIPDDCWALRQGKTHCSSNNDNRMDCKHVNDASNQYVCEPINAQGELLGVLHFELNMNRFNGDSEEEERFLNSRQRLIKIAADNLALSLVSLKLREALQSQSVRDPLTSLFNRRYMEESLEREIHRCNRAQSGIGIILIDIDHFKKFNDEYGHDAGDIVLIETADLIKSHFRSSDIVCRYGGEELIVIMPSVSNELVIERSEQLCERIASHKVVFEGKNLPTVTASFGVVHATKDIESGAKLIKQADIALYQAKDQGRNKVVVSVAELKSP